MKRLAFWTVRVMPKMLASLPQACSIMHESLTQKSTNVRKRLERSVKLRAMATAEEWGRRHTIIFSFYVLLNYLLFFP